MKSRGKRKDNGELVFGNLHEYKDGTMAIIDCESEFGENQHTGIYYEIDPETAGRGLGQLDKNKKPMWQGDIILCPYRNKPHSDKAKTKYFKRQIIWDDGLMEGLKGKFNARAPGFTTKALEDQGEYQCYDWSEFADCEIIGTIHDQSEEERQPPCLKPYLST